MKQSSSSTSGHAKSMAELMAKQQSSFNVFQKGQEVTGKVKKLTPQEILLDIGAKSDALVLEVDKTNLQNLLSILNVGDTVRAVIISPEAEEGFPVVSLRRELDNIIFSKLDNKFRSGEVFEVSVGDQTRGGYYITTDEGIRGFLPTSQVMEGENLSGTKTKVKIIEADRAKKRVIFSQKATHYLTDPQEIKKVAPSGSVFDGVITGLTSYGMYVAIEPVKGKKIEGFVHISEISYERVENLAELFKKDQKVKVAVIDLDNENRRLNLSIKRLTADEFENLSKDYKKEDKVKGTVTKVSSRGIMFEVKKGVNALIPSSKVPAGVEYKEGQSVEAEVIDVDLKRRVINVSPIVTKTFVGYR